MLTKGFDIMISYRVPETGRPTPQHKEADNTAPQLQQRLVAAGYSVFLDVDNLQGGTDWLGDITAAVQSSTAIVPIVSSTYGDREKSPFTYKEYVLAESCKKVIVPVFHSGTFPPQALALHMLTMQYVPRAGAMTGPTKTHVDQVGRA